MPWCYRDDVSRLAKTGRAFVINLDSAGGKGTHWTAARVVGGTLFYADPFGSVLNGYPPAELTGGKSIVNRIAWQRPSTNLCGYYAYLFARDALPKMRASSTQKQLEDALWHAIE